MTPWGGEGAPRLPGKLRGRKPAGDGVGGAGGGEVRESLPPHPPPRRPKLT